MNLGESLLAIGAMALLSVLILGVNNKIFFTGTSLTESKIEVLATSIGTSIVEEASSKAFDEATENASINDTKFLTTKLGPEGTEAYPNFNDFDDYNGLKIIDTKSLRPDDPSLKPDTFYVSCKVFYVATSNLDTTASSKSWNKRIMVTVKSPYAPNDSIVVSSIYSYWYFR